MFESIKSIVSNVVIWLIVCAYVSGMPDYYKTERDSYKEKRGSWTNQNRVNTMAESVFWPIIWVNDRCDEMDAWKKKQAEW